MVQICRDGVSKICVDWPEDTKWQPAQHEQCDYGPEHAQTVDMTPSSLSLALVCQCQRRVTVLSVYRAVRFHNKYTFTTVDDSCRRNLKLVHIGDLAESFPQAVHADEVDDYDEQKRRVVDSNRLEQNVQTRRNEEAIVLDGR